MKLDNALFGYCAVIQPNGLFSLLNGGLAWVGVSGFPAKCNQLVLLAQFSFEPDECGKEYPCTVKVTSPSGDVLNPSQEITLKPIFHPKRIQPANTFLGLYNYDGFTFQTKGLHIFEFSVNGVAHGSVALEAIPLGDY